MKYVGCVVLCCLLLQVLMKDAAESKRRLDESDRARIRLEAEVSAGLIEGAKLTEELAAAQVCARCACCVVTDPSGPHQLTKRCSFRRSFV